jgi:NAD+ synthase (glutamine-hydrolysing)
MVGLGRDGIVGITMPGFGTSERTRSNATQLAAALGVTGYPMLLARSS